MPPRATRCSFKENGRRCQRDGVGHPPLCTLCRLAVATSSMPPSPVKVITDSLLGFLQGKPINPEATIGAVQDVYAQWQQARAGGPRIIQNPGRPQAERQAPPDVDERAELERQLIAARAELGFGPTEVLSETTVKTRHRLLAKKYHPDLTSDPRKTTARTAKMARVNAAVTLIMEHPERWGSP